MRVLSILCVCAAACGGDASGGDIDASVTADAFPSAQRPSKRSDIVGVAAGGTMVVFGGDDGPIVDQIASPAYRDDTWLFDPTTGWRQATPTTAPSARGRYAAAGSGEVAFLFGGRFRTAGTTGNYTLHGDLWSFATGTGQWTEVAAGGSGPSARHLSVMAAEPGGSVVIYGGDTNPSALTINPSTEVWRHDQGWTQLTTTGAAPSPRVFMASAYDTQRDRLVIFGGQIGDFVSPGLNDLYALDLGTRTWSQLSANGAAGAPSGRFSASMLYDPTADRYIMMGGHADPGVANDVWSFDPEGGGWSQLGVGDVFTGASLGCLGNSREIPKGYVTEAAGTPERRSTSAFVLLDDAYWLFGGESDCSDHLDDTWRLSPAGTWAELIDARSGESCSRRGDDCPCLCL
ncbi:MAG TPA: kelch repeat-containing protein [Kofleriaceae bacterium]|nr:kelch repeat-containing protein [Kofleriaceae bacterium]